jgi:hypothetical protein
LVVFSTVTAFSLDSTKISVMKEMMPDRILSVGSVRSVHSVQWCLEECERPSCPTEHRYPFALFLSLKRWNGPHAGDPPLPMGRPPRKREGCELSDTPMDHHRWSILALFPIAKATNGPHAGGVFRWDRHESERTGTLSAASSWSRPPACRRRELRLCVVALVPYPLGSRSWSFNYSSRSQPGRVEVIVEMSLYTK